MKRVAASNIAFWIGVISIAVGILSYFSPGRVLGIVPLFGINASSFIHFANACFLIGILSLLARMYDRMPEQKKEEETGSE